MVVVISAATGTISFYSLLSVDEEGEGRGGKRGGKWRGNESEMGISPAAKEVEAKVDGVSFRGGWMSIGKLRKGM